MTKMMPRPCCARALDDAPSRRRATNMASICSREYAGSSAVSIVVRPRCSYDARAMRSTSASSSPGKGRAHLALDDGAADPERRDSRARRATRRLRPARRKLEPIERRDGAAQRVVLDAMGERRVGHQRFAQVARSPAAPAAAAKPSIIASSVNSRCDARAAGAAHRLALIVRRRGTRHRRRGVARDRPAAAARRRCRRARSARGAANARRSPARARAMKSRQANAPSSPSAATQPTSAAARTRGQVVALAEEAHERRHAERGGVHVQVVVVRAGADEREAQLGMALGEQRERAQRGGRCATRAAPVGDADDELASRSRRRARRVTAARTAIVGASTSTPSGATNAVGSAPGACARSSSLVKSSARWRAVQRDAAPRRSADARRPAGCGGSPRRARRGASPSWRRAARAPCGGRRPR